MRDPMGLKKRGELLKFATIIRVKGDYFGGEEIFDETFKFEECVIDLGFSLKKI